MGGLAGAKIEQFATWLWDKTAGIRQNVGRAWKWIKDKLGIGEGQEGQNGLLQWVQGKASAAWSVIKELIEPIKKPLIAVAAVLGGYLIMVSPAGPLVAMGAAIVGLIKAVGWVRQHLSTQNGVVNNRGVLQNVIIPQVMGGIRNFTAKLQGIASSILGKIVSVSGGLGQVIGAVSSSIISFAVGAVQWIADQFKNLAEWASEKLMALVDSLSSGLEHLVHFLSLFLIS